MGALSGRAAEDLFLGLDRSLGVRIRMADPGKSWLGRDPWTPEGRRKGRSQGTDNHPIPEAGRC